MRKRLVALLTIAAVMLALLAAWPFVSAGRLKLAIRTGDVATVEQGVDWPRVKATLKASLLRMAQAEPRPDAPRPGVFRRMARRITGAVAPSLISRTLDSYGTAEALVALDAQRRRWSERLGRPEPKGLIAKSADLWRRLRHVSFKGPARVEITIATRSDPRRHTRSVFELRGWRWILTEMHIERAATAPAADKG
ncbi:MAG: DUF2939 domain-containing protein [Hyphomicrobiaceae bacterium]|nr:DUF2939 domain-containing protein [Hyphomicrobiaceae bacterium]